MNKLFFALMWASCVWAQQNSLHLQVTFPAEQDTFTVDRLRISGNTHPEAVITVNDKPVKLLQHGAFVTRTDLHDGMNKIVVKAQKGSEQQVEELFVYREPKLQNFLAKPTSIDPLWVEPKKDVWVRPGDVFTVIVKGSPNGQASFEIEKIDETFSMTELPSEQSRGLAGVYSGCIHIPEYNSARALNIEFVLKGLDGRKKTLVAPGKLHILPVQYPLVGITREETYIQSQSEGHAPLQRIPKNVHVQIIGREKDRYKIQLAPDLFAWIDHDKLNIQSIGSSVPNTSVTAPQVVQSADWIKLIMPIDYPVPFIVQNSADMEHGIKINLYGAHQASHWITYPNTPIDIEQLTFQQIQTNVLQIQLIPSNENSWGYKLFYQNGALHFYVRREPIITADNPFRNIKIAIDPGHGGEEDGAVGALGVKEKDVNLLWAKALYALLRNRGADVTLLRTGDETLALPERVQRAQNADAHLYLSLHNNSVGPSGNALNATGTSVYFSLPQNKALCWAIYPHMYATGLAPYGKIYNSYYVTTSTEFLTALIEGCFITNPQEELLLADEKFIQNMASAVCAGVEDFLKMRINAE